MMSATHQARTLSELLSAAATSFPTKAISFYAPGTPQAISTSLTYPELLSRSLKDAKVIHHLVQKPGSIILLHFDNHFDNVRWFWAVTTAGYVATMSTPFSNNPEQRQKHLAHLHTMLEDPIVLTRKAQVDEFSGQSILKLYAVEDIPAISSKDVAIQPIIKRNKSSGTFHPFISIGALTPPETPSPPSLPRKSAADVAILMLTSGSTGNAKAVELTHQQLLMSVTGKAGIHSTKRAGVFLNWIGLDHVAAMTEAHLHAMLMGSDQVMVQAADLIQDPLLFLDLISKHRVDYTFAPNFFLASLLRAIENPGARRMRHLDLSCLDSIISGGEAVVIKTAEKLDVALAQYGAKQNIISPGFGMTETCAGSIYNKNCPAIDIKNESEFANLGECVKGISMRVTDATGAAVPSGVAGNLEVSGPIVFKKYFNNPQATKESFNGEWFVTGDNAIIDQSGHLHLVGRSKDTVIINGLHYVLTEIEAALEQEQIPGATPSYFAAIIHRATGSNTEGICIVYCPTFELLDVDARVATNDAIARSVLLQTNSRPVILPLDAKSLQKSTLGKLSRAKIRTSFEAGEYKIHQALNDLALAQHAASHYEGPETETEKIVLKVLSEILTDIPQHELGVNANFFSMGVTSIDVIKIKKSLEHELQVADVPMLAIMTNPSIRSLGQALLELQKPQEYNPAIVLRTSDSGKTPLWLVHPGVGEMLVFFGLASHIHDRTVYAFRARGFELGEAPFTTIPEVVSTYVAKIKATQPTGPYAIAGYSYGSMIAFEITKQLNQLGDEVKFLGVLNLPPHIAFRMRQLSWTLCLLNLVYFLDLFTEEFALGLEARLEPLPKQQQLDEIMLIAPQDRLAELGIDRGKLERWADLAFGLQNMAVDYEPSGEVACIDVFAAVPLRSVADGIEDWKQNKLAAWKDFVQGKGADGRLRIRSVEGAHYTMLGPEHVKSFVRTFRDAWTARGI